MLSSLVLFCTVYLNSKLITCEICDFTPSYKERYRPQIHYSPPCNWMNDPNGLVTYGSTHHMYFQHDPDHITPKVIHWGHAVSDDFLHWKTTSVAIFPNQFGVPFSGSAIVDHHNVTGLQRSPTQKVMIAIHTRRLTYANGSYLEEQHLSYSNDKGQTWKSYEKNPIIKNPGIKDFRDPKVLRHKDKFVVSIAAHTRIMFYGSTNLISWSFLSEFGEGFGSHYGDWECPDLIPLTFNAKPVWVLLVSTNPGGVNLGSATQYFIGNFDGKQFSSYYHPGRVLWLDYAPDCYAGITWENTSRYICWMSNWLYGKEAPTKLWRGQMSIPRDLSLKLDLSGLFLASNPISLVPLRHSSGMIVVGQQTITSEACFEIEELRESAWEIHFQLDIKHIGYRDTVKVCVSNTVRESVCLKYIALNFEFILDRSMSGDIDFSKNYTLSAQSPRLTRSNLMNWIIILDVSSVEFFIDDGLTVMTSLFFPVEKFSKLSIHVRSLNEESKVLLTNATFYPLKSIWF